MEYLTKHATRYITYLLIIFAVAGCGNSVDSAGDLSISENWQLQALEGVNVTFLEPDGTGLLIGTGEGLFQLRDGKFINLGLNEYEMRGAVRLKGNDILAAVLTPAFSSGDVTIFKKREGRSSWEPYLNNYGGDDKFTFINTLKSASYKSDTLFAKASGAVISRSVNAGKSWSLLNGIWDAFGGSGIFIKVDPFHSPNTWSGGTGAFFQPYLIKSKRYGDLETWVAMHVDDTDGIGAVTSVFDVVVNSQNKNLVLAGLDGFIIKSTNEGEKWTISLDNIIARTFSRGLSNPDLIFASGRDPSTNLFFAITTDFGETWEKEIFTEGPEAITTNDLEILMIDGREVLFLATDQGLYSFTL